MGHRGIDDILGTLLEPAVCRLVMVNLHTDTGFGERVEADAHFCFLRCEVRGTV